MEPQMLREVFLVAGKDLRAERRSLITLSHVVPFALTIVVLFGMALEADRSGLRSFAAGLFWVIMLLASVLAIHRSVDLEGADRADEGLLLSGLRPAAIFFGKAIALIAQLLVLGSLLLTVVLLVYEVRVDDVLLMLVTTVIGAAGLGVTGTLYGALIGRQSGRETLLPMLLLPVLIPLLLASTRAMGDAFGSVATDGWRWLLLLAAFTASYSALGPVGYTVLMEDST